MKEIRKQKIRKETAQIKIKIESQQPNLGRARDPIQPRTEPARGPVGNRKGIFFFSLTSLTCGPAVSGSSSPEIPLLLSHWKRPD
jgi:hypothetical protein